MKGIAKLVCVCGGESSCTHLDTMVSSFGVLQECQVPMLVRVEMVFSGTYLPT